MPANGLSANDAEGKVSILIVDDRPDKLLTYDVMLSGLDENIVRATSGKEALRALLHQDFAVILLDVNMPGMDGFETAALIRQRPRSETTPIIFISAVNDTINHVSRGYSLGAVDYILTPVVPEILRAKISVFVDLFRKTEQVKRQGEERAKLVQEQAARAEAEAQQKRLSFLAEASNVLASSLEYQETFQNLARLIVPFLADFCVIDIAGANGILEQVALAHHIPGQESRLKILLQLDSSVLNAAHGATTVFRTGRSELRCEASETALRDLFEREEDRELIRSLQPTSFIAVPLRARERVLGAITMVNTTPDRSCGANELSLAEELAQRAAIAVDNARLYKAAQQARQEAERASMAKDRFLAMLSHELRTPLTPVLASVLALEEESNVPAAIQAPLQVIRRNVELEARLIDDLLDLTRISKGKVQLNLEIVDAHTLLGNALEICGAEIKQKHLVLDTEFGARNTHLRADPARLQQIFWNLIKNAVKFTPGEGTLTVRTADHAHGQLRVEISDDGCGIEPELLPRIFNAFEQGEASHFGGLGLGLAITRALVETHHGEIVATSDGRGKGAKFTLLFPTSAEARLHSSAAASPVSHKRKSMQILLVEDHEDTNRTITQLLRRRGYHVHPAHSMQGALDYAAKEKFDVLISDLGLPDGSGTDLMQKLNGERPIFGIALTGFGMEDDIRRSHEVGFDHHLVKPIDLAKLDSLLQQVPVRTAE